MPSNNEIILSVRGATKSFKSKKGDNQVLRGVDFEIRRGQIFALLGSNGAGKTTTVRALTTLGSFDEGVATICGYDLKTEHRKIREVISLTGQYAAVDENLTGRENMDLVAKLRGLKNYRDTVNDLLARFNLTEAADKRVKTYSGGMRRKLDLGMSLIAEPQIIFLDEPTTGLDPQSRLALWSVIRGLRDRGTTILLTTQYLEEAEALADYVAVLHDGKIIKGGTVNELKSIAPPRMVMQSASLEDVFLILIGEKQLDGEYEEPETENQKGGK